MKNKETKIKREELDTTSYPIYCNLYLIQKIYEAIPSSEGIEYCDITTIVNLVDTKLYDSLCSETTEIILLNQVYTLFMQNGIELKRDFLYELVHHLSNLFPVESYDKNPYDEQWELYTKSNYYEEIRKLEDKYEQEASEFFSKYY